MPRSNRLRRRRAQQPGLAALLAASAVVLLTVVPAAVSGFTTQLAPMPSAASAASASASATRSGRAVCASNNIASRDIQSRLFSSIEASVNGGLTPASAQNDDDDEEWVYEEYTDLTESDFFNSEWKIGIVWNDNESVIKETWVRLVVDDGGDGPGATATNVAIWGDGGRGKWSLDVANQFFSISKESFGGWLGKRIFAGNADDYYYLQGSVRGWSPLQSASVLGQWQMKRLGVDREEAGIAPWFEQEEDEEVEEEPQQRKAGVASPEELRDFVARAGSDLLVIDVRNPDASVEPGDQKSLAVAALPSEGYRPMALSLIYDRDTQVMPLPDVDKGTPIITHCGGGGRGQKAKDYLMANGFTNVLNGGGPKETDCWAEFGEL